MTFAHAITAEQLREGAYEARCSGNWNLAERQEAAAALLEARAGKREAERNYRRQKAVHGEFSKAGAAAHRAFVFARIEEIKRELALI